jgi:hypothetical protein
MLITPAHGVDAKHAERQVFTLPEKNLMLDAAPSGESPEQVGMLKSLDDLQFLLESLAHPGLGTKPWAVQLRASVEKALVQLQILRMTKAMDRPQLESLAAAESILVHLRQASVLVSKSRSDELTGTSVRFALALAKRVQAGQKALEQT